MIQDAIILAAGRGTRLAGELKDRPKGFLTLGAKPIIEESIEHLVSVGVHKVTIVTGHCAEFYEDLAKQHRGLIRTIQNPRFADSGSMYSFWCAREAVTGPFFLLESDLIYEPRALAALIKCEEPDGVLLSGPTGAGDEVYVETKEGYLHAMSKQKDTLGSGITGELVGISKISPELFAIMRRIAEDAFSRTLKFDYETDCLVAAAKERNIRCPVVHDLIWSEIDDSLHLARAKTRIYPEICRRTLEINET